MVPMTPDPRKALAACLFAATALLSQFAHAEDITFTGFMSLVGGKVLNGGYAPPLITPYWSANCPCFISNWYTMATYSPVLSMRQESRVGARMNAKLSSSLTGIVQVDAIGTQGSSGASLEWAYLSYIAAENWNVQVGRKPLPIYYYSDFMDVGFAYPWVRPPQDLYGWEVNNFNGITLVNTGHWGHWSSRASIFYGGETSRSNPLAAYSYPGLHVDLVWHDILGADLELTRDWFNVRAVYIQSKVDLTSPEAGILVDNGMQRIYGLSANIDYDNWLMRSELSKFDRWQDMGYKSNAAMVSLGYHFGDLTPMLTYSFFHDDNNYGSPVWENDTLALTLRYDLDTKSAIKLQYDKFRERSLPGSTSGNANVLSVSFDKVF